ncbi:hypothetical protein GCM10027259_58440 [Micromonospora palomenae]
MLFGAAFFVVALGFGVAVRVLAREAAWADRVAFGLAVTVGDGLAVGDAVALGELVALGLTAAGTVSATTGAAASPEVSCTAPTVPPTASTTPTAAVAAMPAGEENMRVRACLPATGPVLSSAEQTGSDRNERSTSEVNVIMVVWPELR